MYIAIILTFIKKFQSQTFLFYLSFFHLFYNINIIPIYDKLNKKITFEI